MIEARGVESLRERREIAAHLLESPFLGSLFPNDIAQLLHCELYARQLALERARLAGECPAPLVESADFGRHLRKLLEARLVVEPVNAECLCSLGEMLDDSVQALSECAAAGRACPVRPETDHALSLLLDLGPLATEVVELGLCVLSVANPLRALCLERALRLFELCTLFLELVRDFFLLRGRAGNCRVAGSEL